MSRCLDYCFLALVALLLGAMPCYADDAEPVAEDAPADWFVGHKLAAQLGYGPDDGRLGADPTGFGALRYQPTLNGYFPDRDWPLTEFHSRLWFDYKSSQTSTALFEDEDRRVEGTSMELRDFYVTRNRLLDDPRWSLGIGRQRYASLLGLWWDSSLESLRLDWFDSYSAGFLALGERFHTYNTSLGRLEPEERDIAYLFGQYGYRWAARHWFGVRWMTEVDHGSGEGEKVSAARAGLYAYGLTPGRHFIDYDYWIELAALTGQIEEAGLDDSQRHFNGWAIVAEAGSRFSRVPWQPRIGTRFGITDAASESYAGFYLNAVQSSRLIYEGRPSTGLAGSFINLTMTNTLFYGLLAEMRPARRTAVEIGLFDIRCRADDGPLPINRARTSDSCSGGRVGGVADLRITRDIYPRAFGHRQLNWQWIFNLGLFHSGGAISPATDDVQAMVSTELTF